MRRGSASIAANPVLIGAATTLVVIVAVFLAYNANSGLPFVPTYELKTRVPNAANLVKGNDVRIGGTRVGAVTDITPVTAKDGSVTAELTLKLETTVKPLPVDSTVLIRPRSALGLKYVEITKGTSSQGFEDGATIPLRNAQPQPVELDEVLSTFDAKTRAASQSNLTEFGNALRRPGARPQPGDRGAQPAADQPRAGHAEPLGPTDARRAPGARPRADRVDRRTGGRDAGGAVRQPRHDLPRPRQRRAPVPAGLDQRRAARARRGDQGLPAAAAVPGQQRGPLPRAAARGPGAVDGGAGPGRRARDRHADAQALGGVQQEPRAGLRGARALRRRPARHARRSGPQQHRDDPGADDRPPDAGPDGLQLRDAVVPQRVQPAQRRRQERHQPALHHHRHAAGAQQRGRPVVGARQRRRPGQAGQLPARATPIPNTASPGQPKECEAGNEPFLVGKQVIGNVPGTQSATTEKTTRQR